MAAPHVAAEILKVIILGLILQTGYHIQEGEEIPGSPAPTEGEQNLRGAELPEARQCLEEKSVGWGPGLCKPHYLRPRFHPPVLGKLHCPRVWIHLDCGGCDIYALSQCSAIHASVYMASVTGPRGMRVPRWNAGVWRGIRVH